MNVHQDVLETLNKTVLPQVMRVHEMGVPYPAQLWVDGQCEHENGVAMFNIGEQGFSVRRVFRLRRIWNVSLGRGIAAICRKTGDDRHRIRNPHLDVERWPQSPHRARLLHAGGSSIPM